MMSFLSWLQQVLNIGKAPQRPLNPADFHPVPSPELEVPWRQVNWNEKEKILENLQLLKPTVEPLRILLHGPVGAGKSCFINSVQKVLLGRNVSIALASSKDTGQSFTLSIKTHKLKKRDDGHYPFVFCDIMGLETDEEGIDTGDIINVLEGHILDGYTFSSISPVTENDPKYNHCPDLSEKVHCLVSIVPADAISIIDHSVIDKMRTIRQRASDLGIPQVIVLTKVDVACEMVREDLRKLYHSRKIKEKVEESSIQLGIPMKNIYPVKNFHAEITEDSDTDVIILMALIDIVNFASDYVEKVHEQSDN
ncbi:interferon-induced protein 44-like [Pygocentrus nattereri]|uniref:interferon-induced protein 44-like n=1 Tax=Pygocentrus nattereri TaxID=42514 RepID=UPI001891E2F7|nr:interferon-induced protein 44-like [Pygocentrus nattereri]